MRYQRKAHGMCNQSKCNVEPWWLTLEVIGFEDDDGDDSSDDSGDDDDSDDSDDDTDDSGDQSDDSGDDSEDDDDDDTDEEDKAQYSEKDVAGLKSALKKERATRRQLQKELKAKAKAPDKGKKKDDDTEEEDTGPSEREIRLATKLRDQEVDRVIGRVARRSKYNFADMDDVIALVNRKALEVDQDDEDPSDIEVDEDTVLEELKRLAKKKHLLTTSKTPPPKSGSKMGGKNSNKDLNKEDLVKRYPALRRT